MQINDVSITLELDRLPPSVNHCYIVRMHKGAPIKHRTPEFIKFIKYIHSLFPETYKEIQNDGKTILEKEVNPLKGRLGISMKIIYGDKRKRDLGNSLKVIEDSLQGKAFEDDNQIDYIEMRRVVGDKPNINIKVWSLLGNPIEKRYGICAECGKHFPKDSLTEKYKMENMRTVYVGHVCEWCF